ncbi:hypothetical protein CQW23_27155 [Capsicum baccatum]|uniref:BAH domain-containing protein n=1 Tax=Capsicum baccatum TaxID=33114 RepID=A0A2G2VQV7_CAPBA|nr:hypothetical protein CQW23_27155 [Capsicum baccatum]
MVSEVALGFGRSVGQKLSGAFQEGWGSSQYVKAEPLKVLETDEEVEFVWGRKRGLGGKRKEVQFYESFTYDGMEYALYDCVYMHKEGELPYIGKIIKIWENPDKSRKIKIHWFFRPSEILYHLKDVQVAENEVFLASGEGTGLANVNSLLGETSKLISPIFLLNANSVSTIGNNLSTSPEVVVWTAYILPSPNPTMWEYTGVAEEPGSSVRMWYDKLTVGIRVVVSKDLVSWEAMQADPNTPGSRVKEDSPGPSFLHPSRTTEIRNPQMKKLKRLTMFSTVFLMLDKMYDKIGGLDVKYVFNRQESQKGSHVLKLASDQKDDKTTMENQANRESDGLKPQNSPGTAKASNLIGKSDVTAKKRNSIPGEKNSHDLGVSKLAGKSGHLAGRSDVDAQISPIRGDALHGDANDSHIELQPTMKGNPAPMLTVNRNTDTTVVHMQNTISEENARCIDKNDKDDKKLEDSYCRSRLDRFLVSTSWEELALNVIQAWEEVMQTSNEQGTLVLLENLNPEYTSGEVEDIIWHACRENGTAKMVQRTAFSSPDSGRALVAFQTKEASERVSKKLDDGCLMVSNKSTVWYLQENIAGKPQVPLEPWVVAYPNGLVNTNGPQFAPQPAWEPSVDYLPITRSSPGPTLETMGHRIPIWLENSSFTLFHPFDPQTAPLIPKTHTFPFLNLPGNPRSIFGPKHTELA